MARRRMFSLDVVDTDTFLDMPCSARLLYYDLGMRADDDGFLQGAQKILRTTGASRDDLKVLISRGFVIPFESGVVVIRHWKQNNEIKKDRRKLTVCVDELALLAVDNAKRYELRSAFPALPPAWIQIGDKLDPQNSIVQERRDEESVGPEDAEKTDSMSDMEFIKAVIDRFNVPNTPKEMGNVVTDIKRHGREAVLMALTSAQQRNKFPTLCSNFYRLFLPGQEKSPDGFTDVDKESE